MPEKNHPPVARVFSLRKRLISSTLIMSILSSLLSLGVVVGVVGYDIHQLFDDILEENSKLLLEGQMNDNQQMKYHLDEFNEELELDYQVINAQGSILRHSKNAPSQPFIPDSRLDEEFHNVYMDGQLWRVFIRNMPEQGIQIQLAQPWQQRYAHLLPAIGHFLWLMILLWLLLLLGNWLAIRHSLKPLKQITDQVSQKSSQDLSPVQPVEMMQEMQPVVQALNQLLQRLDLALQAEQQFTADAAHELRTPLSAIQMKLQLLQRRHADMLSPIQPELEQLRQDVKRSTAVVENLLILARLDPEHSQSLAKTEIVLAEFLRELCQSLQPQADVQHIQLLQDWQIKEYDLIYANQELLFTALRNVLENAIRYAGQQAQVKLLVFIHVDSVDFIIQDDGQGVSAEDQARLTQRFFRVLGTEQHGSGLGLSIVQRIVELHHARMTFIPGLQERGFGVKLSFPNHSYRG